MEHHPRSPPEKYYQATSLFPELSPWQKKTNIVGAKEMQTIRYITIFFGMMKNHVIKVCWQNVFHPSNLFVIPKKVSEKGWPAWYGATWCWGVSTIPIAAIGRAKKTQVGPPVSLSTWFFFHKDAGQNSYWIPAADFVFGGILLGDTSLTITTICHQRIHAPNLEVLYLMRLLKGVGIPLQLVSTSILGTWKFFRKNFAQINCYPKNPFDTPPLSCSPRLINMPATIWRKNTIIFLKIFPQWDHRKMTSN